MIKSLDTKRIGVTLLISLFLIMVACISVNAATYNESEGNDYSTVADDIIVETGNNVTGQLKDDVDEQDFFKFTLSKGSLISFKLNGYRESGNGLEMYIYSDDGIENDDYDYHEYAYFSENLGQAFLKDTVYLKKGTYYIKITDYLWYNGSYSLDFTAVNGYETVNEPNETIGAAMKMTNGKTYYGLISNEYNKDSDFFKAPGKGYYYITLKNINLEYIYLTAMNGDAEYQNLFTTENKTKYSQEMISEGKRFTQLIHITTPSTFFKVYSGLANRNGKYQVSITKKMPKIAEVKVTKESKSSAKIKWKKQSGVDGYKIYRSTKKDSGYKLITTVKGEAKSSYINKKLKSGKTYYYKICAYKSVNGYTCKGYYSSPVKRKM